MLVIHKEVKILGKTRDKSTQCKVPRAKTTNSTCLAQWIQIKTSLRENIIFKLRKEISSAEVLSIKELQLGRNQPCLKALRLNPTCNRKIQLWILQPLTVKSSSQDKVTELELWPALTSNNLLIWMAMTDLVVRVTNLYPLLWWVKVLLWRMFRIFNEIANKRLGPLTEPQNLQFLNQVELWATDLFSTRCKTIIWGQLLPTTKIEITQISKIILIKLKRRRSNKPKTWLHPDLCLERTSLWMAITFLWILIKRQESELKVPRATSNNKTFLTCLKLRN